MKTQTQEFQKQVVYVRESDLNSAIRDAENGVSYLQEIADAYNSCDELPVLTEEILFKLALKRTTPMQLWDEEIEVAGVKTLKSKISISTPSFSAINAAVERLKGRLFQGIRPYGFKDGQVFVKPEAIQQIKEQYTVFAETPEEVEVLQCIKAINDAVDRAKAVGGHIDLRGSRLVRDGKINIERFSACIPSRY